MRRLKRNDDGVVAVVVALLMVGLLLLGAFVIDIGALYAKKRQLQNGVDAAVRAVATDCAKATCGSYNATGSKYTSANARVVTTGDSAAPTTLVECGTTATVFTANSCTPTTSYVRVTASKTLNNHLATVAGIASSNVAAQAIAHFGAAGGLTSELPLTLSICEWRLATANGTSFKVPPFPPWPTVTKIFFHDTTEAAGTSCTAGNAGSDYPISGGFGWLKVNSQCVATSQAGNWYDDKPGRPAPGPCTAPDFQALLGRIIHLPIYDGTNGLNGSNGQYHMIGYAAFYLTGFSINGQYKAKSLVNNQFPCNGPTSCLEGFFTQDLSPTGGTVGTGPNMGVTIVQMIG